VSGITLADAEAKLAEALDAVSAVMGGQEYRIGNRWLTRADLDSLQKAVVFWDAQCKRLARGGGIRITGGTPV
jgi:hypothetical protein